MSVPSRLSKKKKERPHPIWGELLSELWELVFAKGTPTDFNGLLLTSRWAHNLFWEYRTEYDFHEKTTNSGFMMIMDKCSRRTTTINIQDTCIDSRGIEALSKLNIPYFQNLCLDNTEINDDSIKIIGSSFLNLRSLSLRLTPITDDGIAHLTSLTKLETLLLQECRMLTEHVNRSVGKLTKLKRLDYSSSPAALLALDQGRGVQVHTQDLPSLCKLLGDCEFGRLSQLSHLETFDSGPFMALTDLAISALAGLTNLKNLRIQQAQLVLKDGMSALGKITSLVELHLYKVQFVASFHDLAKLTNLVSLNLKACFITGSSLETLPSSLIRLNLSDCPKLKDSDIEDFLKLRLDHTAIVPTKLKWIKMESCRRLRAYNFIGWLSIKRQENGTYVLENTETNEFIET